MIHWSVIARRPDKIDLRASQRERIKLMIVMVELESFLENLCDHVYSAGRLCTDSWPIGDCANLPSAYARFPLRLSWCGAIYRHHYPSLGVQQLLMASVGWTDLSQWQLINCQS